VSPESSSQPSDVRPVRDGIAIGVAVGIIGSVFGVLATTAGLSVGKTCAMSLLVFTGATQFAAVSIVGDGGTVAAALGTGLLLAARNTLYGPLVARWFASFGAARRLLLTQVVIDESTGIGAAQSDADEVDAPVARKGFLAAGLAVYVFWNLGTLAGALTGEALGRAETLGLDAAFPAAFVALLAPHLRTSPGRLAALVAGTLAVVSFPFVPVGVPVLLAALGALPAAWLRRREEVSS
jgi:4-azaleucine resistance transporter AzlC